MYTMHVTTMKITTQTHSMACKVKITHAPTHTHTHTHTKNQQQQVSFLLLMVLCKFLEERYKKTSPFFTYVHHYKKCLLYFRITCVKVCYVSTPTIRRLSLEVT